MPYELSSNSSPGCSWLLQCRSQVLLQLLLAAANAPQAFVWKLHSNLFANT